MGRMTIDRLTKSRLAAMTADERAVFDGTYEATRSDRARSQADDDVVHG